MPSPQTRFIALHDRLCAEHPDAIREAKRLAAATVDPRTATADAIWRVLWDKPLYANTRVQVADRWVASVLAEMPDAWRIWGADPKVFAIRHLRPGVQRQNFEVRGNVANDFVTRHGIALHRLCRIQGAATALRARASRSERPFSDIHERPLSDLVPALQREFGPGWGPITVLHALTDMGLAVKPDLWLVRSVRFLNITPGIAADKVPGLADTIRINADVRSLLKATGRPDTSAELRYVDKVLMELSKRGLLQ
jgi:hypothetical protein